MEHKPRPKPPKARPDSLRQKQLREIHGKELARVFDHDKVKPAAPKGVWAPGRIMR